PREGISHGPHGRRRRHLRRLRELSVRAGAATTRVRLAWRAQAHAGACQRDPHAALRRAPARNRKRSRRVRRRERAPPRRGGGHPARPLRRSPDGKPIGRDIAAGEVIYRGPCKIAAAGTVPYYGFGFRVFPYALRAPGRFQLRLTAIGVPKILSNLRTLWRGGPPPSGVLDFHC